MNQLQTINKNILLQEETDHLTIDEFHLLLEAVEKKYKRGSKTILQEYIRDRNAILLMSMWVTGARVSDVLRFRTDSIDYQAQTLTFYVQKRKKTHRISLDAEITLKINNFVHKWRKEGYLFTNINKENPVSRQYVNILLKDMCKIAYIRNVHAHLFRHGLATYLLAKGVSMEVIAYRLAHSNVTTTAKYYARVTPEIERGLIKEQVPRLLGDYQ